MEGLRFSLLIDMLARAFRGGPGDSSVSQGNYTDIVWCLRKYDENRAPVEDEHKVLERQGWPTSYHPCDHMERIRWGMTFGDVSDEIIDERVKEFAESYADGCAPPRSTTLPTVIDVFRGRHRHADEIIAAALRAYRDGT